jgi:hypothetical protein
MEDETPAHEPPLKSPDSKLQLLCGRDAAIFYTFFEIGALHKPPFGESLMKTVAAPLQ